MSNPIDDANLPDSRNNPYLADLQKRLRSELKWQPEVPQEIGEGISSVSLTERSGRGFYGEDLMLRTLSERGEIILDAGRGPEDVNKGGPDAVTLGEDEAGNLKLKFYDNKAYSTQTGVSSVSSLTKTFEKNVADYREEWGRLAAETSECNPVEQEMYGKALELLEQQQYERIVTNYNGKVVRISDRVSDADITFEDMHVGLEPPPKLKPIFGEQPQAEVVNSKSPPVSNPVFAKVNTTEITVSTAPSTPTTVSPSQGTKLR